MITKKIAELEKDRKSMEQTVTKLSEENEMMDKEIGRLRHLQQLRSKPTVQQSDQKKCQRKNSAKLVVELSVSCVVKKDILREIVLIEIVA